MAKGEYEVISGDLSGNEPSKSTYPTEEDLISSLEDGDWSGSVILAIFGPDGQGLLEEMEDQGHIHDENH